MTLSDYLEMIFPKIGGGMSRADFIINIISNIMEPIIEQDTQRDAKDEYNPLSRKKDDTLTRIFSGKKDLAARDAREILSHLDKKRFENYLYTFSNDAIDSICKSLRGKGVEVLQNETIDVCAELLVTILGNCAEKKNKKPQKKGSYKNTSGSKVERSPHRRHFPSGTSWGNCGSGGVVRVNCGSQSADVAWGSCGSPFADATRKSCNPLSDRAVASEYC